MNFSALPQSKFQKKEFEPPKAGIYVATISKTEMRTAKSGNEYLSVTFDIETPAGAKKGKMFEMFMESDKSFIQYKLRRFVEACGIPCQGEMTLKDLGLLVNGSKLVIWTQVGEWNEKARLETNLRDAEGFYPMSELENVITIYNKVNGIPDEANIPDIAYCTNVPEEEVPFDEF